MDLKNLKKELLKDDGFKKAFSENKLSYEIAISAMEARISKGLSQNELAKKVGTKQPGIARLESGTYLPNLSFLKRIASALGTELIPPKFKFLDDKEKSETIALNWYLPYNSSPSTGSTPGSISAFYSARVEKINK